MQQLGIDIGASTVKLVLMEEGNIIDQWIKPHYGMIIDVLLEGLSTIKAEKTCAISITGANRQAVLKKVDLDICEDIPATVAAIKHLVPEAGSIIEIGSQQARFITSLNEKAPQFSTNEHCAGGTGSFFEDQMSRLSMKIEDYSSMVQKATEIPNLSGRCAVFAKTDIIHRQQEGVLKEDILLGLCYAMIRNYKATIVKNLPVEKPVSFVGGVTLNKGVIQAIQSVFHLEQKELIVCDEAIYASAIGAALHAKEIVDLNSVRTKLSSKKEEVLITSCEKLVLSKDSVLTDPVKSEQMPETGVYMGIDVGSTSTDLVLIDEKNELVDFEYLRTSGDPEGTVRKGLSLFQKKYGDFKVRGVGITGSGRERLGRMMQADSVKDEITAQAKAASYFVKDADTVFEIGGQDSKYISLKNGQVADFQMNKICAAGTGSFVEEQAAHMNIKLDDFGKLALSAEHPCDLGERCTVFIGTSISQAEASGRSKADIAAGLCHSIVKNYLHKVVGNKPVGQHIVLQGGVDYNPGIVAAFQSAYRERMTVSPVFSISGAYGVALLAKEEIKDQPSTFAGFDFPREERKIISSNEEIRMNKAFYKKAGQLASQGYDGTIDPSKKTIGVPLTLIMFKFFPMVNAFFKNLGYNVILSKPTNEKTIALAQQYTRQETCYPVKLIYGHMMELASQHVDYIFLPAVHTIKHPHSHAIHSYACPYMQKAGEIVFNSLELDQQGIQLLNPVLDLELGAKMMAKAMLQTGKELGFSKARCMPGLLKGAAAVNKNSENIEESGRKLLASLKPDEKVLVLITRNYGLSDPVLNMGIPEILLNRGYKVITLGHLPGMSLDLSEEYPNMYWPFGDHILSGAKLIAHHPNLYAIYLTNHGCGPDTIISHLFKEEMKNKPYLQIEVDEHFSKVGVITRIEAFLNSLKYHKNDPMPSDFNILNVDHTVVKMNRMPDVNKKLYIPDIPVYASCLETYFNNKGIKTSRMVFNSQSLMLGRSETNTKEYLPFSMFAGSVLYTLQNMSEKERKQVEFLIPLGYGGDSDGQYARAIRAVLNRNHYEDVTIVSPLLEQSGSIELFKALLKADLLTCLQEVKEEDFSKDAITLAKEIASNTDHSKRIGAIGSPLCVTTFNDGILDRLKKGNVTIIQQSLSEMMCFLWKDSQMLSNTDYNEMKKMMDSVSSVLKEQSPFSNMDTLFDIANKGCPDFAGNQGRYRYAKAIEYSKRVDALLLMAPRYENTATVLSLLDIVKQCQCPCLELAFDGDWDENSESKLQSFLYYC